MTSIVLKIRICYTWTAIVIALLFIPCITLACDVTEILKQAYPSAKPSKGGFDIQGKQLQHINIDAVKCKVWPANPALTLVAVPLKEASPASEEASDGDLELLVMDTTTGQLRHRLREQGMMDEDAVRIEEIIFDTARYDISPGQRAFGLRILKANNSRMSPFSLESLWMYVLSEKGMQRVMSALEVKRYNGYMYDNCVGTFEYITRTVTISLKGKGYRDLIVHETGELTAFKGKEDNCSEISHKKPLVTYRLHYNGQHYVVPKVIRGW